MRFFIYTIFCLLCARPAFAGVPPVVYTDCATDTTPTGLTQGTYAVGEPANDILALCEGWVAISLHNSYAVRIVHAPSGTVAQTILLTAEPGHLAYDPDNGFIFATLLGTTSVARINLSTGVVTYIPVRVPAVDITEANCGMVIAATQSGSDWADADFDVIDGVNAVCVSSTAAGDGFNIAFDHVNQRLAAGVIGDSPSSLYIFQYNPAAYSLTQLSTVWNPGSNGEDIAVSPDGMSTAFACGGGNSGTTYGISDFSTSNPLVSNGTWNCGNYPSAVAFSPGGAYLLATNSKDLIVFRHTFHTVAVSYTGISPSYDLYRVAYSRGGGYVFGEVNPVYYTGNSSVFWAWTGLPDPAISTSYCGTPSATPSATPNPTSAISRTSTLTGTPASTWTVSPTITNSSSATLTYSPIASPTMTPILTVTNTISVSPTFTPSPDVSASPTPSFTLSATASATPPPPPMATVTPSISPGQAPYSDRLGPPYPEPYHPGGSPLTIPFGLSQSSPVTLKIYDLRAQEVAALIAGQVYGAGSWTAQWNGLLEDGSGAASGVYFVFLATNETKETKRILVVR